MVQVSPSHAAQPSWLDEVMVTLRRPNEAWCDEDEISFVVAANELNAWLHDKRPYEWRHGQGWESAIQDFEHAARSLGPELASRLCGELSTCQSVAQSLQTSIATRSEANLKSLLTAQGANYRAALEKLLSRFGDADVRLAAWKDLLASCRNSAASYPELATRRDLFFAIIRAANLSDNRVGGSLVGVLADDAFAVHAAKLSLGEADEFQSGDSPRPHQLANLGESERLSLCERLLTVTPAQAHHVVWVAFQNAYMDRMMQAVGPTITFYDAELIKSLLASEGSLPDRLPAELKDREWLLQASDLPEERDTVLARVDLGRSAFADPVVVAREQAEAVVAVAGFRFGKPRWRIIQGHLHAVDGRLRGWGAFMTPFDAESLPQSASSDPMSDLLSQIEADLAPHLPVDNPELMELIRAVHAWQGTGREEPLSSIILHVRILELVASRVTHGSWHKFLDDYLASSWVRHKIISMSDAAAHDAALGSIGGLSAAQKRERREIQLEVFKSTGYGVQWKPVKAYKALPKLASMHPLHSEKERQLRYVTNALSSPTDITVLRDDLAERWKIARARLQRIRNALAHGGPVDIDSAKTVHGFVRQLSAWSLSRSLEGILKGNGVVDEHGRRRDEANSWFAAVPSAADAKSAIFPR